MLEQEYELFGEVEGPMQMYGNFGFTHRERFLLSLVMLGSYNTVLT
jgi:hypothetical protein